MTEYNEDMCNRYNIHTPPADIVDRFQVVQSLFNPPVNYHIAPTTTVPVVRPEEGARVPEGFRWRLAVDRCGEEISLRLPDQGLEGSRWLSQRTMASCGLCKASTSVS